MGLATRPLADDGLCHRAHHRAELPDYEPRREPVIWFRDYAAHCFVTASGRTSPPWWQSSRYALQSWHPAGREPEGFALVPGSTMLVEDSADDRLATIPAAKPAN